MCFVFLVPSSAYFHISSFVLSFIFPLCITNSFHFHHMHLCYQCLILFYSANVASCYLVVYILNCFTSCSSHLLYALRVRLIAIVALHSSYSIVVTFPSFSLSSYFYGCACSTTSIRIPVSCIDHRFLLVFSSRIGSADHCILQLGP